MDKRFYTVKYCDEGKYPIYTFWLKDLIDDKESYFRKNRKFESYNELFKETLEKTECFNSETIKNYSKDELLRSLVIEIARVFWKELLKEIIDENNFYILPRPLGKIYVKDLMKDPYYMARLRYPYKFNGRYFYPIIEYSEYGKKKITLKYQTRLSKRYARYLKKLILTGHKW